MNKKKNKNTIMNKNKNKKTKMMRCDLGYERIHPEVGEGLIQPGDVKDGEHDRLLTRLQ